VRFARIDLQVVHLGPGPCADRLPPAIGERLQRRPAGDMRVFRFAVHLVGLPQGARQVAPFHRRGRRDARGAQNRRRDLREADRGVDARCTNAERRRRRDHERHAERGLVQQHPVRPLAVLAQRLAVIARDDDERAIEVAARAKRCEHASELRVGVCHFAVVRRLRPRGVLGRRRVRGVRIVEVDPQKEGIAGCGLRSAD